MFFQSAKAPFGRSPRFIWGDDVFDLRDGLAMVGNARDVLHGTYLPPDLDNKFPWFGMAWVKRR